MKRRLFVLAMVAVAAAAAFLLLDPLGLRDSESLGGEYDRAAWQATPRAPGTFRIATYNILYSNKDLDAIAANIYKSRADVVCLQEVTSTAARRLRKKLKQVYRYWHFHPSGGPQGCGFLSRTPLKRIVYLPKKYGPFGTLMCQTDLAGKTVQIANVHLVATAPGRKRNPLTLLKLLVETELTRKKEIVHLYSKTDANVPLIVAGDLNSPPAWRAPAFLRSQGLIDSLAATRADHGDVVTWSWSRKGISGGLRIDYIFHASQFTATAAEVLTSNASDHSLQVSTLKWAPKPTSQPTTRSK